MAHRWTNDLTIADATPRWAFVNRRRFIGAAGTMAALAALPAAAQEELTPNSIEDITD